MLRFSPTAWAKLKYFRDAGQNEVGGFAVTAADDLLRVEQFVTVKQETSVVSVEFDDEAVADFFDAQVDAGRRPEQFGRCWLHTHPGDSPTPSGTDEETFHRVFGKCQWAVMFILARNDKAFARLRFNVGPGGQMDLPVQVDYSQAFEASDGSAWREEYEANIEVDDRGWGLAGCGFGQAELLGTAPGDALADCSVPEDWIEELEAMEPEERKLILDELAARPELWEEEVTYESV